jgi:hypothetical protein
MPASFRSFLFGVLALAPLSLAAPAHAAVDAAAVGKALADAVGATGRATLTFDGAQATGDGVTLSGVKLSTNRNGYTITAPAVVLSNVAMRDGGGFTADRMTFDGGSATAKGDTAAWKTATLAGVVVPSAEAAKSGGSAPLFGSVDIQTIAVSGPDFVAPVAIDRATLALASPASGTTLAVTGKASGVHLPTALLSRSFLGAIIHQLDYQEFVADVTLDAVLDASDNTAQLNTLSLDAIGAGKITASGKASGISLAALANPETFGDAKAAARFNALTVRLDNAGFVQRVLDLEAKMLGYTADEVRSAWTDGALPIALSVVKDERFRNQMLAAVTAFLADPKSLTLTFQPAEPVPVGQLARTAAKAPATLPDLLTASVQANN